MLFLKLQKKVRKNNREKFNQDILGKLKTIDSRNF